MPSRWNWLRLLTYCLSRALAVSLVIAVTIAGCTLAFAGGESRKVPRHNAIRQAAATYKQTSGVITDSDCGARHIKDGDMSSAECARFCVRKGAKYILVDGENRYSLTGNTEDLSKLAGQRVTISGARDGDSIRIDSVFLQ
jgi:hypothetical protein